MSWNIQTPGDYINGPLTVAGVAQFNSNVGVGVAPSAWNSNYNAIDIGANGSISGRLGASNTVDITSNAFRNSGGDWIYKIATSSPAARYQVDGSSGSHLWYSGVAGTAGNTITGFSTALMTLSSTGLGLGTSPAGGCRLTIQESASQGTAIALLNRNSTQNWRIAVDAAAVDDKILAFIDNATSVTRLGLTDGGTLLVGPNAANANGGCLQLKSGITLPATQVASTDANTLDDYEEGTWTPTITASSGTPTTVTVNLAAYTKIGRLVSVAFEVTIVNVGTATGQLQFTLPFSQATDSNTGAFRDVGLTALMGQYSSLGGIYAFAALYNNATVWVNGYRIRGTFTYTV